jgi:hypothetical protein
MTGNGRTGRREGQVVRALSARIAVLVLVVGVAPRAEDQIAGQKPVRLRGYVVEMASPTELLLDDYRLIEDRSYRVMFDVAPDATAQDPIAIGTELEIEGVLDSTSGELRASAVKRREPPVDSTPRTTTISTAMPIEPGERKFWNSLLVEIKEPNFERRRSGGVTILRTRYYQVIANAEIQQYIAELGWKLVPPYQRELPEGHPSKIPFKFYVVKRQEAGAVALGSGVVMVFSRTFEILQNEAQLASVMAHEISHITQKHLWQLSKMTPGATQFGYDRAFENQADRLSLAYIADAGYDPREATRTWRLLARKLGFTPLRITHENYAVRRAYMMAELEQRYRVLDYHALRLEEDSFRRIADLLKNN